MVMMILVLAHNLWYSRSGFRYFIGKTSILYSSCVIEEVLFRGVLILKP